MARYSKHFATYQEYLVFALFRAQEYLARYPNLDPENRADWESDLRRDAMEIISNAQPPKNYNEYTYQQR